MIPLAHTAWAVALVASLAGNLWLVLSWAQLQRDAAWAEITLATERADRERERADRRECRESSTRAPHGRSPYRGPS